MRVPNKIRVFAWRLCKESLPTQQNLNKKNILTEGVYCFYKRILEDTPHAIPHCPSIEKYWREFMPMIFSVCKDQPILKAKDIFQWNSSPVGVLKLNVDGAMFRDPYRAGIGVVLHDERGDFLMETCILELAIDEPQLIELLASDCLLMVNDLQAAEAPNAVYGILLSETKKSMQLFEDCSIQYVNHMGNVVAHKLARFAYNVDSLMMWWDYILDYAII
ncbi:hypothetical protein I3843_15G068900 [Carya illinoinensis]|nr:hypothetical protein I3843_15G068900 [Carya illinoinensis]